MWNDPKLSRFLGVPVDLNEENLKKTSLVKKVDPTEIVVTKTKSGRTKQVEDSLRLLFGKFAVLLILISHPLLVMFSLPLWLPWMTVLHEHANFRLGYFRRGVSLTSPPSPSPSYHYSSDSVASSPSITTVRFILDRGELRNRDRLVWVKRRRI